MSAGNIELTPEPVSHPQPGKGILGVIREQLSADGDNPKNFARKVFNTLITPVPQAPVEPSKEPESPFDPSAGSEFDRHKYTQMSGNEVEARLKAHSQWIRKGEQGFLKRGNRISARW